MREPEKGPEIPPTQEEGIAYLEMLLGVCETAGWDFNYMIRSARRRHKQKEVF